MQITHIVKDSPLRDLGVVLSQCAHVVVPEEEDSFEYDAEEELDIPGGDDGDSEETDDDYVPEGGGGEVWASQMGRGVTYRKSGWVKCLQKKGRVKFKKREWVMFLRKKGRVKFRKRGWVKFIQKRGG